jgi:hypothetical protein
MLNPLGSLRRPRSRAAAGVPSLPDDAHRRAGAPWRTGLAVAPFHETCSQESEIACQLAPRRTMDTPRGDLAPSSWKCPFQSSGHSGISP